MMGDAPRLKKRLANLFILVFLGLVLTDAMPSVCLLHQSFKDQATGLLFRCGLWQGCWNLFAPEPDKVNVMLVADLTFADGKQASWRSPDWRKLPLLKKFFSFRHAEFVDGVAWESNKAMWPSFADYLARTVRHPNGLPLMPIRVEIKRYVARIPPPSAAEWQEPPDQVRFKEKEMLYTKTYSP